MDKVSMLGFIDKGGKKIEHQSAAVYDVNFLSPCLSACDYKQPVQILVESENINVRDKNYQPTKSYL